MTFLNDFFATEKSYVAEFQGKENVYSGNTIVDTTYPVLGSVNSLIWDSSVMQSKISEKYKEEIDSIIVFNYGDLPYSIVKSAHRIYVNNELFSVLARENIGNQNEIIRVFLKKYEQ